MDITTSILLIVIVVILAFWIYNWLFTSRDYWTSRGIPSVPGALPIFGNTLSIFRLQDNLLMFCKKVYESYQGNSMVGFYNLKNPVLLVRDPELVKTVLQTSFNNFRYNGTIMDLETDPLFGRDPLFSHDQAWKHSRGIFQSGLTTRRIKNMISVVEEVCKRLDSYLEEKVKNRDYLEIEAKSLFSRYSCEIAAGCVFGVEGNSFADDCKGTFFASIKLAVDPTTTNALRHNMVFFVPALSKLIANRFVPLEVDRYFRRVVKDLANLRPKNDEGRVDVLHLLFDMEKTGRISRIDTLGHTFSFFLESVETSSLALSSISYAIAKHQDVQNRLRAEVETVLANHEGQLTYEAINEMSYLDQVMNEAFRLYPVTGVFSKVCTEAFCLKGSDGLVVDVEPGITVIISVSGLEMDPEFWENPSEFDPERFRKGNDVNRHKYVHLPFSEGPRSCPGQRFATVQIKAAMATVIRKYRFEVSPKMQEPVRMDPAHFLSTPVGGFWIRLRPLKN